MKTVLVTGGAGFIGAHLVRALLQRGKEVRVLDNLVTGSLENLSQALEISLIQVREALGDESGAGNGPRLVEVRPGCQVMIADIRDEKTVAQVCRGVDVVFHQAGLRSVPRSVADPLSTNDVNVNGTMRVLEGARKAGVRRVVFASSSSIYGDTPLPKHEKQVLRPKSPYAASKLSAEAYCQAYTRAYGLSTVSLRYFNVFGPWQDPASEYAAVIPKFISLAIRGEALPVHGDGLQSRDFTYVDNVVEANLLAAQAGPQADGLALNVGTGARHSLLDLIELLTRILDRPLKWVYEPPRTGDVRHTEANIKLARNIIGYDPKVDFASGLRRTVEAMRGAEPSAAQL